MKYGVVSYEKKYLSLLGPDSQNMGDWIQMMAMENLYDEWGIHDYLHISRNTAKHYSGEKVVLCFNCFNTLINGLNYRVETFPLSQQIIPVFFGLHFHNQYIPAEIREQFLRFGPIGCRDEETLKYMLQAKIPAYLSGCVTSLFPKREGKKLSYNKIYFIDVPKEIEKYVPENILERAEYKSNAYYIQRITGEHYMTEQESKMSYQAAKEQLELLRDTAELVVTSRLHIASPCIAMGIPVILVANDFNGRFAWIEKYIPLYAKKDWPNIDWNPKSINYEREKQQIKNLLKQQLFYTYAHYSDLEKVNQYYKNRVHYNYNSLIKSALQKLKMALGDDIRYAICGVISPSLVIYNTIKQIVPKWELVHVYDDAVTGKFEELDIERPEQIFENEDIVYFVDKYNAYDRARELFQRINKKYVLIDLKTDDWETNI